MSLTVDDGVLVTKDPGSTQVYLFDWDAENLPASVTISSQITAVTAVSPSTSDTALTLTQSGTGLGILAGNRTIAIKLAAGTLGQLYHVTCQITTSESPAQVKERTMPVLIENL